MRTRAKEDLSIAYLLAVCAKSGVLFDLKRHDEEGADVNLSKSVSTSLHPRVIANIEAQLKSTSSTSFYKDTGNKIIYKAKAKCYNDLIEQRGTPLYLFLLILPADEEECVHFSVEELLIRKCMYWAKLDSSEKKATSDFVDIELSKSNVVSPDGLNDIMQKEGDKI